MTKRAIKCTYADWKYCWQNEENSTMVRAYGCPDSKECAACLTALVNWGKDATLRPLTKEEMLLKTGKLKLKKCANCGKMAVLVNNGRCKTCQERVDEGIG